MTTLQIITLLAIVVGPVLAVVVQLIAEKRKVVRDHQASTFRMLVSTRHLPGDPNYSTAINMIPIDFNSVRSVMTAHASYIEAITFQPTPENMAAHEQKVITKQTKLVYEISQHLGYDLPETDIQSTAYAAGGFVQRDNLMLRAWEAWPRIADALERELVEEVSVPAEPEPKPKPAPKSRSTRAKR